MTSNCPKCKKAVEHEDFMFEVLCECGTRFNPFMGFNDTPAENADPIAAPAWTEPTPEAPANFQESQSVFDELKEFAETGGTSEKLASMSVKSAPAPAAKPAAPRAAMPVMSGTNSQAIMTSGDGLPGYRIESYLPPVSAAAELDPNDSNPLHKGFNALWEQAAGSGAMGIVAVRWVLSPDGTRVILSGTPVICQKES